MSAITNIDEAKDYLSNLNLYKSGETEQDELFDSLSLCEQIAQEHHDKRLLIHARIFLTNYYIQVNDLEKALKVALENKNMAESENLEEEQLNCYSGLLNIHHLLGDYSSMEELISVYREKLLNSNNLNKLCSLYIFSAIQHYTLKDQKKCMEANEKALQYALQLNNPQLLVHIYNNYGFHALSYDPELAYNLLSKNLSLIKDLGEASNLLSLAASNINLADYYNLKEDYKKCNECLDIAIDIAKKLRNKNVLLEAENKLCELFIRIKDYETAESILLRNENNCLEKGNRHILLNIYNNLHILYKESDNYQSAYNYLLKYQELKNTIFSEESLQKIQNLQITNEVKEIKLQRDHAERLAHLKHDFLANMSHEIRTPINSVLGICYLLQQDQLNDKQKGYIKRLESSGESLLHLINEILDISKIEAGKLELVFAPFNFNSLLSSVTQSLQHKADEKQIALELFLPDELNRIIHGDAQRLSQIFINLMANAIKFTDKGYVKIHASILSATEGPENMLISCTIEDSGIGIPEDKLQTIFERYEQAAASIKTQFGGTGLGLAISKRLVDLMGGQLSVKSRPGEGAQFTVTIPFGTGNTTVTENQSDRKISDSTFLNHAEIIITDDMEESRLVLKDILQHFNPTVNIREAANGEEVLTLMHKKVPDILLMDLDMPVMNGFETTTEIRKHPSMASVKIIAHTAGLLTLSKEEILNAGFDELLTKPFNPNDFLHTLHLTVHK